jgi:hypothetical protein
MVHNTNTEEKDMQKFLTNNSFFLSHKSKETISNHDQKRIQLGNDYIPDFIVINIENSILVEIESPNKKIFKQKDEFTSEFNQSIQQLRKWKVWLKDPVNLSFAQKDVAELDANFKLKLIIGRNNSLTISQKDLLKYYDSEIEIITYDDLISENEQIIQNYSKL